MSRRLKVEITGDSTSLERALLNASTVVADAEGLCYPTALLDGCRSGLLLFASGRGGRTDGVHFRDAQLEHVTAVDWDAATLDPMRTEFPGWEFAQEDALAFARGCKAIGETWDVVSVDAPSQYAPELVSWIPLWLSLATRVATITLYRHCFAGKPGIDAPELADPPDGWAFTDLIHRSSFRGGIWWLVCERSQA